MGTSAAEPTAPHPDPGSSTSWWRRHRRALVFAVGAAVALAVIAGALTPGGGDSRTVAVPGPGFRLPDLRDPSATVSLADFRGRPVVVNFWASWCVPCRQEMPALERVYRRVRDRVAFVGVDHEDARPDALDLMRRTGVRYPIGYDPDGKTAAAYGLFGMPTTLFVDARGRVLERHTGQISERTLEDTIGRLFPKKGA